MLEIITNGSKWAGDRPANLDTLLAVLEKHPLDRPMYRDDYFELSHITPRQVAVRGNFQTISHAFNLRTNEVEIIECLVEAIEQNMQRPDYQNQIDLVTLRWNAENKGKVDSWQQKLAKHGGHIIYSSPALSSAQHNIILNMPRSVALLEYGYTPASLKANNIGISLRYVHDHIHQPC